MKRMTKLITIITSLVLVLSIMTACGYSQKGTLTAKLDPATTDTQIVMTIGETDGNVTALDALLCLRDLGKLTFEYYESSYGAYITSINGKAEQVIESTLNSSKGYSWMLYTSDKENGYDYATVTVNGKVCYQAALGASTLKAKAGETYVWVYEYYDFSW